MPVSGFFSSIADKAQNAINQTPLAGHIHGTSPPGGSSANTASQDGYRFALESLQHQIRNVSQQYSSAPPMQRIITLEKGVALDVDALARDSKQQSKELYTWGQHEDADLTDVTDRLAFISFVHGSLSTSLALALDGARVPLKALRDAETAILPKRNLRAQLRTQIARLERSQEKGAERRAAELKEQLRRAEGNDEQLEKELELLKRKAIRESEEKKWDALQEYAEKLVLVSQAAKPIIGALPTLPPSAAYPYEGTEVTAAAKAALQHVLDNYQPGQTDLNLQIGGDLSRSDTRTFGESHASELSSLTTSPEHDSHPGLSVTPPIPEPAPIGKEGHGSSGPVQPIPVSAVVQGSTQPISSAAQGANSDATPHATVSPFDDLYGTSPVKSESPEETKQNTKREEGERTSADGSEGRQPGADSAKEEKKRLEREERERVLAASNVDEGRPSRTESAEEEKKRLEREERERVLTGGTNPQSKNADGDDLPPYRELQE